MHLAHGATDYSRPVTQCLFTERYLTRGIPSQNFFSILHWRLVKTSSFQRAGREWVRIAQTPDIKQTVLQQMQETPSMNILSLVHTVRISHSSIRRILREHGMYPFHVQRVQALLLDDYAPRPAFAQ